MSNKDGKLEAVANFIVKDILYNDTASTVEKQLASYMFFFVLNARITNKYENAKWMKLAVEYSENRKKQ